MGGVFWANADEVVTDLGEDAEHFGFLFGFFFEECALGDVAGDAEDAEEVALGVGDGGADGIEEELFAFGGEESVFGAGGFAIFEDELVLGEAEVRGEGGEEFGVGFIDDFLGAFLEEAAEGGVDEEVFASGLFASDGVGDGIEEGFEEGGVEDGLLLALFAVGDVLDDGDGAGGVELFDAAEVVAGGIVDREVVIELDFGV